MIWRSIALLTEQDSYELKDLQRVRELLKEHFPAGLPSLSVEGEIIINCSFYDDMVNVKKVPIQTPLNHMFLMFGSRTGTEAYVRKHYAVMLEKAHKGVEAEKKRFSIMSFPMMRNVFFSVLDGSFARVYKLSRRADTNLLAAYFLIDLEEYKLMKGSYPVEVSQLTQAGLTSQLPNDPDTDGKIIYLNDGERAVLYAVGSNAKDDGGYKSDKNCDTKRGDIIYWQRDLKKETAQ